MEPIDWVPWALTALAIPQTWYMRNKHSAGWLLNLAGCIGCAIYNTITEQWGFIPLNIGFGISSVSNYRKWRRDERKPVPARPVPVSR